MTINKYGIEVLSKSQATKLVGTLPESESDILASLMGSNIVDNTVDEPALIDSDLIPDLGEHSNIIDATEDWALDFLHQREVIKSLSQLNSLELPDEEALNKLIVQLADRAKPGCWTRLTWSGQLTYCEHIPDRESGIVFDTETFVKHAENFLGTSMPIIGTALTHKALYIWLHKSWDGTTPYTPQLLPLTSGSRYQLAIAHNISFDFCRVTGRFDMQPKLNGLCTMALNNVVNGLDASVRFAPKEATASWGCGNSLLEAYEYNTGKTFKSDKSTRDLFVTAETFDEFIKNQAVLLEYAIYDVVATLELLQSLYPKFLQWSSGQMVPLVGIIQSANTLLPVREGRKQWIADCDAAADNVVNRVVELIMPYAEELHQDWVDGYFDPESKPLTLGKLDWRLHKPKNWRKKTLPEGWPVKARWYEALERKDIKLKGNDLPNLLQLCYNGNVLHQVYREGWQYETPNGIVKVPHESGNPNQNVGNILATPSIRFVVDENDVPLERPFLTSAVMPQDRLIELLFLLDSTTTWSGFNSRVKTQVVVNEDLSLVL